MIWISIWKWVLVLALILFFGVSLVVIVGGFIELRTYLKEK